MPENKRTKAGPNKEARAICCPDTALQVIYWLSALRPRPQLYEIRGIRPQRITIGFARVKTGTMTYANGNAIASKRPWTIPNEIRRVVSTPGVAI
jgi:hypothetical protein